MGVNRDVRDYTSLEKPKPQTVLDRDPGTLMQAREPPVCISSSGCLIRLELHLPGFAKTVLWCFGVDVAWHASQVNLG